MDSADDLSEPIFERPIQLGVQFSEVWTDHDLTSERFSLALLLAYLVRSLVPDKPSDRSPGASNNDVFALLDHH